MKTIKKINILSVLFVGLMIAACGSEEIVREPSPNPNPNSSNLYFDSLNVFSPVLPIDATSFDLKIGREKNDAEQTVNIVASSTHLELFEIPSSVSFGAGESEKVITIKVKDMELMKKYNLTLQIDQEQTKLYSAQVTNGKKVFGRAELVILKEDFAPFAEGTYYSDFFEEEWNAILEFSPATEIYRFKDCWTPGYDVTFKWKDAEVTMLGTPTNDKAFIFFRTGYVHSTYGMVSAYYSQANTNYYDAASKKFTFPITWRVSAGSFGAYNDTFTITKEL